MHHLGIGLGYRKPLHHHYFTPEASAALDFIELHPENYARVGGEARRRLEAVRARFPIITHGLALSLGGTAPLDAELIDRIAEFVALVGSPWHSDHLCWSSVEGSHLHELLPVPFTRANARRIAQRVKDVASALPVPFGIENVSAYSRQPSDEIGEADFISEIVELADCKLLLDVNNLYVNAINFGDDPLAAIERIPAQAVVQIHIAGFEREGAELAIDNHGQPIDAGVWPLLEAALRRTKAVPILLERDNNLPPFAELLDEIAQIRRVRARALS